ncbi:MAG: atp-dependent rna helicase [Homavirus sp.]|uniref:Atp-dependent rna helicase n=1 Tax=Homavirus sp. TaxID=2487769 RepID=A0A3G5A4S5_9VIRU|nr:MAG: atp-dependent rna helicase [Homavirus sp.]
MEYIKTNGVELKPHQIPPINFIKNNFGLILYHSTGSGKTITSLVGMYQLDRDIIIIGPKSANKAFTDEIIKLNYSTDRFTIYTYAKIKSILKLDETIFTNKCVIVDEAHHLKTPTRRNMALYRALKYSYRVMLLTATPVINHLSDISILVNIVKNNSDLLPVDPKLFNFLYFNEKKMQLENEKQLYNKLKNSISYYEISDNINYPKGVIVVKKVVMSSEQLLEYKKYIKKLLHDETVTTISDTLTNDTVTDDINLNIDFDTIDIRKKNAFLTATRQLSNTIDGDPNTPKMQAIYDTIKNKNGNFPAVVYSNYLKNGIFPMAKILGNHNISFQIITGNQTPDEVRDIVDTYNSGKIQVLLLSSAGSESLDLKNTRQIHIMEPHWNEAKIKQVIGRAIRYKSHADLLEKDRTVNIYRWISIFGEPYKNKSADEYLTDVSKRKQMVYDAFKKIIIDSSIENNGKNLKGGLYFSRYIRYLNKYRNYTK